MYIPEYAILIWLQAIFALIGFLEPIIYFLKDGIWSAPHYKYVYGAPWSKEAVCSHKNLIVCLHAIPSLFIAGLLVAQPILIAKGDIATHTTIGWILIVGYIIVVTSALIAWHAYLEPVSQTVYYLQLGTALGASFTFILGFIFIHVADPVYHSDFMFASISFTYGAGIFRFWRSIYNFIYGNCYCMKRHPCEHLASYPSQNDMEKFKTYQQYITFLFVISYLTTGIFVLIGYCLQIYKTEFRGSMLVAIIPFVSVFQLVKMYGGYDTQQDVWCSTSLRSSSVNVTVELEQSTPPDGENIKD